MGRTVTKSIAIIGEGETEWFYFDSLRIACRYPFKVAPDFPQHSDINHILKLVESYLNKQYDYIVCLFDMDRLFHFPSEMQSALPHPEVHLWKHLPECCQAHYSYWRVLKIFSLS